VPQINGLKPLVVDIERIRVLHQELTPAQDAGPRPRLVAVLRLDLEQQQREVLVAAVFALDRQGEQLFMGGAEQVVILATVLKPEDAVAVFGPAVGHLIRRLGQQCRKQNLLSANGIHFVADDLLDLAQHPQAEGQPAVEPGADRTDVAGPDQELMARYLGVGRVIAQGAQEQLGHAGDHSGLAY
jgi:hypothetical protein